MRRLGSSPDQVRRRDAGDAIGDRVAAVAARTYDISEFIVDVLGITDVGAYFPHRVTYHPSCHSVRVAKVGDKPMQLLKAVHGITVLDLPNSSSACGMGWESFLAEEPGHVGRHGQRQGKECGQHRCRVPRGG